MSNFGIDKLNFYVPFGNYEQSPEGLKLMNKSTITRTDGKETSKYFLNTGITTEILNDGNLVISCNPSRLQEPKHYHNPKTYLTINLEPLERTLEKELEKSKIYVDNVLNLKICRLDVASQGVSALPMAQYRNAMELMGGKYLKKSMDFGATGILQKNKSFQSTIYDKSAHAKEMNCPIKDINLLRCEQRAIKSSSVKNYFAPTLIELLNLSNKELKIKWNKLLDAKVFHKTYQLTFDFNTEKQIFNEIFKNHPNNAVLNYFAMEGVTATIQKMGGIDVVMEFLKNVLSTRHSKTLARQNKKVIELLIMWNRTQENSKDNVINQTNELKELFYQKIA